MLRSVECKPQGSIARPLFPCFAPLCLETGTGQPALFRRLASVYPNARNNVRRADRGAGEQGRDEAVGS